MTSAPERIENSIPRIRSLTVKLPSREARTATSRVEPATPLPPTPLPSIAAISPLTKVPWPTRSFTSALRARVSKLRAIRPRELGMAHVDTRVDDGDRALRAAAGGGERLGRADVVVEPGELDPGGGIDRVEGVDGGVQRAVRLDVRHARIAAQRRDERGARGGADSEHADRLERLGLLRRAGAASRRGPARRRASALPRARARAAPEPRRRRPPPERRVPAGSGSGSGAPPAARAWRLTTSRSAHAVLDRVGCLGCCRRQRRRTGKDGQQRPSH